MNRESKLRQSEGLALVLIAALAIGAFWLLGVINRFDGASVWHLCQPAIEAHLPAAGDFVARETKFSDSTDGTHQVTGAVRVNGSNYHYDCHVKDGRVADVVVTPSAVSG